MRGSERNSPTDQPRSARSTHSMPEKRASRKVAPSGRSFSDEGVLEARLLEGVVPPERPFPDRGPLGLGNPAIQVVDDRRRRLRDGGQRVLLLEAPPVDEVAVDGLGEGSRVVEDRARDEPDARIEKTRRVSRLRQLQERVVEAEAHGLPVGKDGRRRRRGVLGREGQRRLDLGIEGKGAGTVELEGGASHVLAEVAGLGLFQRRRHERVVEEEVGGVDEHAVPVFGDDGERGQDRGREGFGHDAASLLVGDAAAVGRLDLPQEDPRSDALEAAEAEAAELSAIEHDVDEPRPSREPRAVEHVLVRGRDLRAGAGPSRSPSSTARNPRGARGRSRGRRS